MKQPAGAVLVVGAGIGGMQASLDLAEAGLKVYLLERSPAIGGTMAQLDKTFPTNDCAMCIMSPRLVEVGRHLNIELLTTSEVEAIRGEPGDFQVRIRRHPRYVDLAKCTGCGDCAAACPVSRPDGFNRGLSQRKAIFKPYPQAIPNAYAIEKAGTAPCRDACPIHQRAQGYTALIREGRFADAYRTIKEDNPFPSICGRVCSHRCEEACSRNNAGSAPVNLMALKRFAADWWREQGGQAPAASETQERSEPSKDAGSQREATGKKVAVVGSGPAGLTCALDLTRRGHTVTVFEALPVPGGMMRVGVPSYRLPHRLVQGEIDDLLAEGIELRLNSRVEDIPALLGQGYDAVFVAVGAHRGVKLPIPGADLPGVTTATEFLRKVSLGIGEKGMPKRSFGREEGSGGKANELLSAVPGKRVLVLGGGNVAIDAAMSALRLGAAWAGMACLESRQTMPAHDWEIRDAAEEGVQLFPSRTFKEITSTGGQASGVRCAGVDFRGFIEGRPDFDEIPGTEEVLGADLVIFAIGQQPEIGCLKGQVETVRGRTPRVDAETLATSLPGLFCGGDAVTGTAFIVDAIAAGRKAAYSIDRYLREVPLSPNRSPSSLSSHSSFSSLNSLSSLSPQPISRLDETEVRHRLASDPLLRTERAEVRPRPASERRLDFDEVYAGLTEEQARAEAARCLACGLCSECLQCVYTCQANAIDHDQAGESFEIEVGAVILAPGLEPLPGEVRPEYGYGRYPNVVTSLEFERMLSASGPFAGVVQRPSDGAHPRKIAWIQCVGSRDEHLGQGYCSSVCCMYAAKEALIAKEHDPQVEPAIFHIDARAFGKGFDAYLERAERQQGVRLIRSMVSSVKEVPGSRDLRLGYAVFGEDGRPTVQEEEFELVVLSVGLRPTAEAQETARRLGVALNEYGFAEPPPDRPAHSSRPGIFIAGSFGEPKDIPETVIEAGCAAAQASALLAGGRGALARQAVYPPERDVSQEAPRLGVFVCHCGINIGGVVDVPAVVAYARGLPGVVYAERNLYTCSQDTQEKIAARIREQGLNRVVVASCTPRTHEPLFQDTLRQAGLNPHLFEMANIREQDAWVHRGDPAAATQKAEELVAMAAAKARHLRPLQRGVVPVERRALVIGGGLAGMTAALSIAAQGFPVYLVERQPELGGNLRHIHTGLPGSDPQRLLQETLERISREPLITVFSKAEVEEVSGYVGQYRTTLRLEGGERSELAHGVIVVATGGQEIREKGYGYGQLPGVITQRELEALLADGGQQSAVSGQPSAISDRRLAKGQLSRSATGDWPKTSSRDQGLATRDQESVIRNQQSTISNPQSSLASPLVADRSIASRSIPRPLSPSPLIMIQCAGSRDQDHPYCSRVCCTQALKNALEIKRRSPQTPVTILYRDIRSYGFRERLYYQARRAGVMFLRFDAALPPQVRREGEELVVEVSVQPEGERRTLHAGLVVLSAGIEAGPGSEALSRLLKLPLNAEGFFLEAHVKLRPVDFAADGVFLCGLAHSPRGIDETIAQAQAAAVRAVGLLSRVELAATPIIASVNPRLCAACGLCVQVCPYGARILEPGMASAEVIDVLCQGCGACVVACPNKASQQKGFEFLQVAGMIEAAV